MIEPKQITHAPDGGWVGNEYSSVDPFSLDCKHLLLVHIDHFELYDGTGKWLSKLPPFISASSEPRWSRTDPHLLYYVSGNELREFDVRTERSGLVHTFTQYSRISGKGESDISADGNHLVFIGDDRYVFVYQISADRVGQALDTAGHPVAALYLTPSNQVLIVWA